MISRSYLTNLGLYSCSGHKDIYFKGCTSQGNMTRINDTLIKQPWVDPGVCLTTSCVSSGHPAVCCRLKCQVFRSNKRNEIKATGEF